MKVRWSATATSELEDIFAYILKHSPKSAERVSPEFSTELNRLVNFHSKARK